MEYVEEDYLMISGIQHFKFCRRQWALIHVEQQWAENAHTVVGELMHRKVHDPYLTEKRKDVIIARALPVVSREMGASGECDAVEFYRAEDGINLHGHRGLFKIYPVEYKKGRPKLTEEDELQLTAQAMCLEEMFVTDIPEAALYYGKIKRRQRIPLTEELRQKVKDSVAEMHQLMAKGYTPKAKMGKACKSCSLVEICQPKLMKQVSASEYIRRAFHEEDVL